MESEFVLSPSLQYKQKEYSHPNYKLLRITPLSGVSSYTLSSSRQQVQFELPANECFNLSRSYLQMTLTVAAQTAFSRVFNDTLAPVASINLRTRSGVVLCDIDFLNQYVRIANRIRTRVSQYLSDGDRDCLAPSKDLASGARAVRFNNTNADVPYIEPNYFLVSASATAQTKQYSVPMNVIAESIFELDKDLWFGEVLIMTLNIARQQEIGIVGTSATDPSAGAGALANANTITNTAFYLATEQNVKIKALVMKDVAEGKMKMILPYVHYYFNNRNGAGQQSVSLRFNRGHGESLRSILHIPVLSGGAANTIYDSNNTNSAKITRYYTTINSMRTEDFDGVCDEATTDATLPSSAWLLHREYIKSSVAGINEAVYFANFFVLDDFTELGTPEDVVALGSPKWNLNAGRSLDTEVKWDIIATQASVNIDHYTFARVSKSLTILPNLVIVS